MGKRGTDLTKKTDGVETTLDNGGDVVREREVGVKDDTKIFSMRRGTDGKACNGQRRRWDLGTLLRGAD